MSVMVSGLPGRMATEVATRVRQSERFDLVPLSFCSAKQTQRAFIVKEVAVELVKPDGRRHVLEALPSGIIAVDYTKPDAAVPNAQFYAENGLSFVMGTTGGERAALEAAVRQSKTCAVIAPNMAKPIVMLTAMLKFAADNFPNALKGYKLEIIESHQAGKEDTSGTAKAMVAYFNALGIPFTVDQIVMVREPDIQRMMGVAEEHLEGHGWHKYTVISDDGNVLLRFVHNVNGRSVYVDGTLDAIDFLARKIAEGKQGEVYSMIDVLRNQ